MELYKHFKEVYLVLADGECKKEIKLEGVENVSEAKVEYESEAEMDQPLFGVDFSDGKEVTVMAEIKLSPELVMTAKYIKAQQDFYITLCRISLGYKVDRHKLKRLYRRFRKFQIEMKKQNLL